MLRVPRILPRSPRAARPWPSSPDHQASKGARAFDTGASIVVRYRERRTPRQPYGLARAASVASVGGAAGLSFTDYVRAAAGPGTTRRSYEIEAFHAGHVHPAPHPPAPRPPAPRPVAAPPTAARPAAVGGPALIVPRVPVAPPPPAPAERDPLSPEDALRRHWAESDRRAQAQAVGEASAEERSAIDALRRLAGQPGLEPGIESGGVAAVSPRATAPTRAPGRAPEPEAEPHPHTVFDRMGSALSYANTFDLGDVTLARRFDEMNAALDHERRAAHAASGRRTGASAAGAAPAREAVLDDLALMQDLVALRDRIASAQGDDATGWMGGGDGEADLPEDDLPEADLPDEGEAPGEPSAAAPTAASPAAPGGAPSVIPPRGAAPAANAPPPVATMPGAPASPPQPGPAAAGPTPVVGGPTPTVPNRSTVDGELMVCRPVSPADLIEIVPATPATTPTATSPATSPAAARTR